MVRVAMAPCGMKQTLQSTCSKGTSPFPSPTHLCAPSHEQDDIL